MKKKKQKLSLVLNEIKKTDDPTLIPCKFIILDFDESANGVVVSKEVALEGAKSIINKPIVGHYYGVSEYNTPTDNFGSHEQYMSKDKQGKDILYRDTTPIGVFTSEGYLETVQLNGEMKEVLVADAVLWYSKFRDACDLLLEWNERGVKINMSCEYLYYNFEKIDGIEYHKSPIIFESHAILASEDRGNHEEVNPAYESATLLSFNEIDKFERLVAQAISQKKGGTTLEEEVKVQEEVETEAIVEEEVTTEPEVIEEVVEQEPEQEESVDVVEEVNVEQLQQENSTLKLEVEELKVQLSEITAKKEEAELSFNTVSDQIVQLSSQLEELKPIKEEYMRVKAEAEKAEREEKLATNSKVYEAKFRKLNAVEQFNSDEVKQLLSDSIEDGEVGKEALFKLNSMLVELVQVNDVESKDEAFIMTNSKREGLMSNEDEFSKIFKI